MVTFRRNFAIFPLYGETATSFTDQHLKQTIVDVIDLPPHLERPKNAQFRQGSKVVRCRVPLGNARLFDEANLRIRMAEHHLDQILAVNAWRLRLHFGTNLVHQVEHASYALMSLRRRIFDRAKHEQHPVFPRALLGHAAQARVIVGPVAQEVVRQEQYGDIQQTLLDQQQEIDDAPRPPVAVRKRVDRLELVMRHCQPHQRVESVLGVDELVSPSGGV